MSEIIKEGLLYTIISEEKREVRVGNNTKIKVNAIRGEINPVLKFPSHISYNSKTYEVVSIGVYAFYGCSSIVAVIFPNTIRTLDSCAFSDCSEMSSIEFLPGSRIETISNQVFCRSYKVKVVILPETLKILQVWSLFLMHELKLVVYAGKYVFKEDVFGDDCHDFDSVQSYNVTILVRSDYPSDTFGKRKVTQSSDVKPQAKHTCRVQSHSFNKMLSFLLMVINS